MKILNSTSGMNFSQFQPEEDRDSYLNVSKRDFVVQFSTKI